MPRKSNIDKLPKHVVQAVEFELAEANKTLDDLVLWLEDQGYEISRSSLGRYKKNFDEERAFLKESRDIAEAFARELGANTVSGEQGQLLVEMMHGLIMRFIREQMRAGRDGEDGGATGMDTEGFMQLARAIKDMQQANRFNQDFTVKLREEIRREEKEKAEAAARKRLDEAMDKADTDGGGDPAYQATLKKIRRDVYGIFDEPGAGEDG